MGVKWDIVIGRGSDRSSLRTGRQKWMYWTYGAHLYSDRKMDELCPWAWDDIWMGKWGQDNIGGGCTGHETLRSL